MALPLHLMLPAELGKGRKRKGCSQLRKYAYPAPRGSSGAARPRLHTQTPSALPCLPRSITDCRDRAELATDRVPIPLLGRMDSSPAQLPAPGHCQGRGRDVTQEAGCCVLVSLQLCGDISPTEGLWFLLPLPLRSGVRTVQHG